jgi:hypothetical protein
VIRRWAGCAEVDDHLMSARSTPTRRAKIYLDSTLVNLSPNPMYPKRHDFGEIQERTHDRGFKASCALDGSHAREILVTNINDNLPHSRPNRATLLIALGLILGVAVIVFWPQISAFAHISEIRNALGL